MPHAPKVRYQCSLVVGVCIRPSVQKMILMAKVKLGEDFKCHRCGTVLLPIEDSHSECGHGTETSDPVVRQKKSAPRLALEPDGYSLKKCGASRVLRCLRKFQASQFEWLKS